MDSSGNSSSIRGRSFVQNLKSEWASFWDTIQSSGLGDADFIESERLELLELGKLKELTKALSQDRKSLNQKLESLHKEIDLNVAKLESLRLVGGEASDTEAKINELSDLGQLLSEQMSKIDERLKIARNRERQLQDNPEAQP